MGKQCSFRALAGACMALGVLVLGVQSAMAQGEICIGPPPTDAEHPDRLMQQTPIYYQLWDQENQGTSCMTPASGSMAFSTRWQGIKNHLARRGLYYGDGHGKTWDRFGGFVAQYTVDWQPEFVTGGNSGISIYGWTHNPVAEYYITENWYQWNHSRDGSAQSFGKVIINGVVYEMIKVTHTGPTPWSGGSSVTFPQYVSVRQDRGNASQTPSPAGVISGTINVSQHFAAWAATGEMPMTGELYEVALNVEGYKSNGRASVTALSITVEQPPTSISFNDSSYDVEVGEGTILDWTYVPADYGWSDVLVTADDYDVVDLVSYKGKWLLFGVAPGTATLTIYDPTGVRKGTASVTVTGVSPAPPAPRAYELRAIGNVGGEKIHVMQNGYPVDSGHTLSTTYKTYTGTIRGDGDVNVEFVNDDGRANGRDVRLDYISVDGEVRQTEQMAINTATYANGRCGGGGYSELLNCNGNVGFGEFERNHTITIRARGNYGGEHINLLVDGRAVNGGWWLTNGYQEFTATVKGDGDLNVQFDNDGGLKDVVVDWLQVDGRRRQAEDMQYNTAAYANGRCGGGSLTQWMHCNGVIGFGKISDF